MPLLLGALGPAAGAFGARTLRAVAAHVGRPGPAAAPLPPMIEQHLKEAGTAAGRAEDTVEPFARWLVGHRS
ncbi:hypothetical protein [Streptomyces sp. NPDC007856]|uniref:hypothetical protein n=1 Tax=Streptomyces sp. NPDC007856 TaxID=3364781 RepID=UPI0036B909F9